MAFVVQNDTGTAVGANSYCDETFFTAYFTDMGIDVSAYSSAQVQAALVAASRYLDSRYRWVGEKMNRDQTTKWPRWGAADEDGYTISVVPIPVKQATCEAAYRNLQGVSLLPDPTYNASGTMLASETVKVGPIQESYTYTKAPGSAGIALPQFPAIQMLLNSSGLTVSSLQIDIVRG